MSLLHGCWRVLFPWGGVEKPARAWLVGHGVCWAAMCAGAWWVSQSMGWQERLVSPWPWLHAAWAPLVVLMIYAAGTLFARLQRHTIAAAPATGFGDIDDAWREAVTALERARLDPAHVPIFLILGKPAHGVCALWDAASQHEAVSPTPLSPEAPFCVTASRGAIFVWCSATTRLGHASAPSPRLSSQQLEQRFAALLAHVAALRRPYCPINGILACMPYAAAATDAGAELARELCRLDVQQARAALGMECPVTLMVGDVQNDPGFRELLGRLSETDRWQALGQRLPQTPDVDPHKVAPLLADSIAWFCRQRLPGLVYDHLQWDEPTTDRNARLVTWLADMNARAERFAEWTKALTPCDPEAPPLMTGCFFAATGLDAATQGCVGGVFKTLLEHQDQVAWTPETLQHAALYRRWTQWALGSAGVAAAVVFGLMLFS